MASGLTLKPDGRQSETALAIQRGVSRLLRAHNYVLLHEFTLASGRRADVISVASSGRHGRMLNVNVNGRNSNPVRPSDCMQG